MTLGSLTLPSQTERKRSDPASIWKAAVMHSYETLSQMPYYPTHGAQWKKSTP